MKKFLLIRYAFAFTLFVPLLTACREEKATALFTALPESQTGVTFVNTLTQTGHFNIIEYLYFYNGGGVSAGDVNNDGLVDLYFTANQLQNKLYINKGNFVFEDVTEIAGVAGVGNWKTGTTMADVNGDGFLDIFVCGVGNYKDFSGRNQLYINNGDLTFSDKTDAYGLTFQGLSTHASFFDYDNDGDLDMYLVNHSVHSVRSYGNASLRHQRDSLAGDRLYRNELIPHGVNRFTDVTEAAGIYNGPVAYGLSVGVSDVNLDGYMDIYVANDFHENDYLYINQGDGRFAEQLAASFPHTSRFSMGNDIADINNDGYPEIITLDMLPSDEEVIKTTAGEDSYDIYSYKLSFGYHHQFARNALQLNRGFDHKGTVLFSDIGALAGVEATDWSWAPLLADFDNDGHRDLFVANGILSRPNDLDYINFISSDSAQHYYGYEEFVKHMPSGKVPNFIFRNEGNLSFRDVSNEWIGENATLSNGATNADVDNDGDLDLIINNIDRPASIFRNDIENNGGEWLQVELEGEGANRFGIGAKIKVYAGGGAFYAEQMLSRGWESSVSPVIHFGLGNIEAIDSLLVVWPDQKAQTLTSVKANKRIKLSQRDADEKWNYAVEKGAAGKSLLEAHAFPFTHRGDDFNAFTSEKLIPHMVSTLGPAITTGDLNKDGLDDFFIGGGAGQAAGVFFQDANGNFKRSIQHSLDADSSYADTGAAIFDANGDGLPDLVVVSGGQQFSGQELRPRLYLNNGSGALIRAGKNLPDILVNASCVKPGDFDADGDTDIFIGGRVIAGHYGKSARSYLLTNGGDGVFADESWRLNAVTSNSELGMVSDAVWNDLNNDGRTDLLLVGEWMPITVMIQNRSGSFTDSTVAYGLKQTTGWWNTLHAGDFDNDGDIDFVVGNLGLNSRLRASAEHPVSLFVGDLDDNGGTDHLLTYFNNDAIHPFISRDQLVKQVPGLRRKFLRYKNFRNVKREDIISGSEMKKFEVKEACNFYSVLLENRQGKLVTRALPVEAQMFPVYTWASGDFNKDGNPDLLAAGNLYAVQPDFGRYDAGYGLMLLGDGKGTFEAVSLSKSGFIVPGQVRAIAPLTHATGESAYVVGRYGDSALLFR